MRFSVVIPAYKAAKYLATAIESALAQTYPPHEVIVIDDCSPDEDGSVAARYPVKYVRRNTNGGPAAAMNRGARESSGDFVALLAADDSWLPGRLAAINAVLAREPDLDIVTSDAFVRCGDEVLRRYYADVRWAESGQREAILDRCFIFGAAAVRRERWLAVGGAPESREFGDDWPFWVRLIMTGSRAACVTEPLYNYQLVAGSNSDKQSTLTRTFIAAMEEALRHELSDAEHRMARSQLAKGRRDLAYITALSSIYEGRTDRRALVRIVLDGKYRKRHRADALFAAVAPAVARRRMRRPDTLVRSYSLPGTSEVRPPPA